MEQKRFISVGLTGVVKENKFKNRYSMIICCPSYFSPIVLSQANSSSPKLILRSLHEIRLLNGSKAAEKLLDWNTLHMEIKDFSWHFGWLRLGLVAIMSCMLIISFDVIINQLLALKFILTSLDRMKLMITLHHRDVPII